MTLPSPLEIVKDFADPSRELRRVPPGQAGDWVVIRNATLEEGEDPYLTSIGVSRQQGRAHAIRSRSNPAGVLVDAWVNDVQTYESPVRPRVQGATP
jgi:hypothetical protein